MNIDQLIRDLVVEEKFKSKYTKRQRSVFCNNMRDKVVAFIEDHEKDTLEKLRLHKIANAELTKSTNMYYTLYIMYKVTAICLFICIYYSFLLEPYYNLRISK